MPIDLSRWKDWSVLDRLVEMYKTADKNGYIRQPVVSYLTVASEEAGDVGTRAKAALADLEKLDPEGVKQAKSLAAFGALARARAGNPAAGASSAGAGAASANGTVPSLANAGATDATQGFGASAADIAAESETKASDIPDPTEFDAKEAKLQTDAKSADKAVAGDTKTQAVVVAAPQVPAETHATANRPLVIGVPLVAAVALMGVYWVILRFGAV